MSKTNGGHEAVKENPGRHEFSSTPKATVSAIRASESAKSSSVDATALSSPTEAKPTQGAELHHITESGEHFTISTSPGLKNHIFQVTVYVPGTVLPETGHPVQATVERSGSNCFRYFLMFQILTILSSAVGVTNSEKLSQALEKALNATNQNNVAQAEEREDVIPNKEDEEDESAEEGGEGEENDQDHEAPAASESLEIYSIKEGDSFWKISIKLLEEEGIIATNTLVNSLKNDFITVNPGINHDMLGLGQKVFKPGLEAVKEMADRLPTQELIFQLLSNINSDRGFTDFVLNFHPEVFEEDFVSRKEVQEMNQEYLSKKDTVTIIIAIAQVNGLTLEEFLASMSTTVRNRLLKTKFNELDLQDLDRQAKRISQAKLQVKNQTFSRRNIERLINWDFSTQ